MKMVSAAKLRKAQDIILQMRPYANKLFEILSHLTQSLESTQDNIYGTTRDVENVLIIAIASNKGLCGGFNANVAKKVLQVIDRDYWQQKRDGGNIDIICIGKKAAELLKSKDNELKEEHHELLEDISFETIVKLAEKIMKAFAEGVYDEVQIIYNQFRNAAVQDLTVEQFLPVLPAEPDLEDTTRADYILEPSREHIIEELIPKSLKIQLYKTFLDSIASEHGARMTAMHKATDNATDLIKELQLDYNKARQAAITTEILEIVAGAEALKS